LAKSKMGCGGSKPSIVSVRKSSSLSSKGSYNPCEDPSNLEAPLEEVQKEPKHAAEPAPEPRLQKQEWTSEASQWRRLLRNAQSLLAACLYMVSTWIRYAPNHTILGQFLLSLLLVPPVTLAYHLLSQNRAGGYYDGYVEMFVQLPQHVRDVMKRGSLQYKAEIEHEHEDGIVRTVNGLETGVLFVLVSWLSALLMPVSPGNARSDFSGCCVETFVFFCLHRICGGNIFSGQCYGLLQPEGMWHFHRVPSPLASADWRMTPVSYHPDPCY